jgi:hypothetical protein
MTHPDIAVALLISWVEILLLLLLGSRLLRSGLLRGFLLSSSHVSRPSIVNPNIMSRIGLDSVGTLTNLVRINPIHKRNFPVTAIENFDR